MKKNNLARMKRVVTLIGAFSVSAALLGGCATIKGAGRDIQSVGQAGEDALNGR